MNFNTVDVLTLISCISTFGIKRSAKVIFFLYASHPFGIGVTYPRKPSACNAHTVHNDNAGFDFYAVAFTVDINVQKLNRFTGIACIIIVCGSTAVNIGIIIAFAGIPRAIGNIIRLTAVGADFNAVNMVICYYV